MNTQDTFKAVKKASRELVSLSAETINTVLRELSQLALDRTDSILIENQKDLDRMDKNDPKYDRLLLSKERIEGISQDIFNVSNLTSSVGEILSKK